MKLRHTFFLFLFCSSIFASYGAKQVYIVYFGGHNENKTTHEVEEKHYSYLLMLKGNKEEAKASLLYSYKHGINGFAAFLTASEASKLSALKEVIHVVKSHPKTYSPQTTKSWDFLGLKELNMYEDYEGDQLSTGSSLLSRASYGKDVIVGIFDSGVWPESKSFADNGMDPIPESWIEKCKVNPDYDDSFHCNGKIIGAKYYSEDFEKQYGELNLTYNKRSPRDTHGHGTHVASIASGQKVKGVATLGGLAFGNASGGAPMTRLAIYKVCWITPSFASDCKPADVLKAIDDAIEDGVHVMSYSIGSSRIEFSKDLISIAMLHATKKNIVVVCAGGNGGPEKETVANEAPWVITVGSSSINRMFLATLELGDGTKIKGQTISSYESTNMASLVYGGNVVNSDVNENAGGYCEAGSLNSELVGGKMVLCTSNLLVYSPITKIEEVKRAGGIGIIVVDTEISNAEYSLEAYDLPVIFLAHSVGVIVYKYIMSNKDSARVSVGIPMTTENNEPSPSVMATSSRGPTTFYTDILKPDIIAPGLNILAAWSEVSSPINLKDDHRRTKYNIQFGTSMSTPHVTAVASLLRAIYSDWSDAAIRSAILTTSSPHNKDGALITDHEGVTAIPFAIGHGRLQPTKASDPGLVYDASFDDYLIYFCTLGTTLTIVSDIDPNFECPKNPNSYELNHPSITIPFIYDYVEIERKVTNVGAPKSNYNFEAKPPLGFSVKSTPERLHFEYTGEVKSFTITVSKHKVGLTGRTIRYAFGYYVWNDISSHNQVRSPIIIRW